MYGKKKQVHHFDEADFKATLVRSRKSKGWDVKRTADACSYSSQQWRNFESGVAVPVIERLQEICAVLDLDPRKTFRLWVREKLDHPGSEHLREILGSLEPERKSGIWEQATPAAQSLLEAVKDLPLDDTTAQLAFQLINLIAGYRRELTSSRNQKKELRVASVPADDDDPNDSFFYSFEDKILTQQHVIARNAKGLGYLTTMVRIKPNCGAFHQHLEDRYLDAGMEFFCIVRGSGFGIFEDPSRVDWKVYELQPGTAGVYRGIRGHTFLNTGTVPLLLNIVCVPFPPAMLREGKPVWRRSKSDKLAGYAAGIEFRLSAVARTRLPTALKEKIRSMTSERSISPPVEANTEANMSAGVVDLEAATGDLSRRTKRATR